MDSDRGKIFVGGISWETTEEKLKEYFQVFGEVSEAVIMKDRTTGRARGFGFVVFVDPLIAEIVAHDKHNIDGRLVEAKKAVPREEQQNVQRSNNNVGGGTGPGPVVTQVRTKKIFVGGLASSVTENEFRKHFEQYGKIVDVVVMYDHGTQRPRGFGFITYDSEDAVDKVLQKIFHELNGKMVEVKRAIPKEMLSVSTRSNGTGLSSSPLGGGAYGSKIESILGLSLSGRGDYPPHPFGPTSYGSGGGVYTTPANGSFNTNPYGSTAAHVGGNLRGSSSGGYSATSGPGNTGFAVNNTAGSKNIWGGGVYPTSGTPWGTSSNPATSGSFAASAFNYGLGNSGFESSPASYQWQNNGFGSSTGGGGGSYSSGIGSFGSQDYTDGYADVYSSSAYTDSVWKMREGENFGSRMGYFVNGDSGNDAATFGGLQTGYGGGFNTTGKQAH